VVPELPRRYADADSAHNGYAPIKMAGLAWCDVLARPAGVEPTAHPIVRSGASQVLRQQVGMAQGMSEQPLAGFVEVLSVNEDQNASVRIGGQITHGIPRE
jgi:hypothetical protein